MYEYNHMFGGYTPLGVSLSVCENVCVANVHCELFKIDLGCTGMLLGWVMCLANPPVFLLHYMLHAYKSPDL